MHARPSFALAATLLLCACGSGSSSDAAAPDTSAVAGLWDASEGRGETRDERYVEISADGRYTEYDYRQDGVASDGNCHVVTELRLAPAGRRDVEVGPAEGVITDADSIAMVDVPTYRLSDGRTVSLRTIAASKDVIDPNGHYDTLGPPLLVVGFGEGRFVSGAREWPPAQGLAADDLTPCEGD